MSLMAEPAMAGKVVQCPGCNIKFQIPALSAPETQKRVQGGGGAQNHRNPWKEEDPTNPNAKLSFASGLGLSVIWFLAILPFKAPAGKPASMFSGGEVFANLFYEHFTISFTKLPLI